MARMQFALGALALTLGLGPVTGWAADPAAPAPAAAAKASAEEVVAKVREAAQYLKSKGLAGFSDFNNNKDSRWVWKDSYVFVYSCADDTMIAHPLRPDMVGKPILQMQDDKGHALFQDMCKAGSAADGGWVEYWWPKPGEAKASRKISFVLSAPVSFKSDIQVGAGIYDDTLTPADLSKIAAEGAKPQKEVP